MLEKIIKTKLSKYLFCDSWFVTTLLILQNGRIGVLMGVEPNFFFSTPQTYTNITVTITSSPLPTHLPG